MMTGEEFLAALKALGVTQRRLADILGVDVRTVNRWVNGQLEVPKYAAEYVALLKLYSEAASSYAWANHPINVRRRHDHGED